MTRIMKLKHIINKKPRLFDKRLSKYKKEIDLIYDNNKKYISNKTACVYWYFGIEHYIKRYISNNLSDLINILSEYNNTSTINKIIKKNNVKLNSYIIYKYKPHNIKEYNYYLGISYTQCRECKQIEIIGKQNKSCKCKCKTMRSELTINKFKETRKYTNNKNYIKAAVKREHKLSQLEKIGINARWWKDASKIKQSITMKRKIANGEFTPCVTNSWANSKTFLQEENKYFRSTWEIYFYIYMKSIGIQLEYETIRIKYFDTEKEKFRNYIVDFYDKDNKILYEIKPKSNIDNINTISKTEVAIKYSNKNNIEFKFIDDDWFNSFYNENIVLNIKDETTRNKCIKNLKQFKRI